MKGHEHRVLGHEASGGATVHLGGGSPEDCLLLTFGDVVALSGDYFSPTGGHPAGAWAAPGPEVLASGGLFALASVPGSRGSAVGTRDEVICALKVMAADSGVTDPRFEPGGEFANYRFGATDTEPSVEQRVRDRFLALGSANDDHFVAPGPRGTATRDDRAYALFGSAAAAYHRLHQRALDEASALGRTGADLAAAMAQEAAAQHYLTDAFAAGHLRTPVAAIREFWQRRYPSFWDDLQRKVASDTTAALRELAPPLRLLPSRSLRARTLGAVRARTAGYPRVSLGDLLAKVFHDWDNLHGLRLEGGGVLFGDGCLDQGVTRARALAACRAGIDDIEVAYRLGAQGRVRRGEPLYAAVREATGAAGEAFRPEEQIPRPAPDNPPQNWEAADVGALWNSPIVGSGGPTVGQAVTAALEAGEELPRRLACLGDSMTSAIDVPPVPGLRRWLGDKACEAYNRGFLAHLMADPEACLVDIVGRGTP